MEEQSGRGRAGNSCARKGWGRKTSDTERRQGREYGIERRKSTESGRKR